MYPLHLTAFTATSALGAGLAPTLAALEANRSGLAPCAFETVDLPAYVGEVAGLDDVTLPAALADYDCRNNRLALLALQQDGFADAVRGAVMRYGAERVGVFLGTSTSGILETELAYRRLDESGAFIAPPSYRGSHTPQAVADVVARSLGLGGPAFVVLTACSSGAKVFASAARLIGAGMIDAAVVGGVDSLCLTTLYGFNSLELVSPEPCRPYDVARCGISIGEAGAFALLERPAQDLPGDAVLLAGVGEASDAYHMSSPPPDGHGAFAAMQAALQRAGLMPSQVDYLNLHGTATPSNDAAEGQAVMQLFGRSVPASSTKGATGHTLGAAGALETVIAALALQHGLIPGSPGSRELDPALDLDYVFVPRHQALGVVMSNSFGFGGSNASVVLRRADARMDA
ncbi:beta-ketoacyl-[acyl-carrier-protein] synthase family protein [Crenobacter sp. SG2303]|uniref:Beta-ketoacyl-[acyl-carrier-protein] synthase family protein n=1 Tax=Crenobacter oryzisoli TaxID=3056844 RepID=A0ABT7XIZ5_9NEIS|nr:beta-ketoacyl-[acyl-carrier-protein] synthase family protein [Crenobacter sp. SG2303]MDN0073738.1 beta-ketoacyl-[acyl-carrier-protein] synthase family protein [Crenobacter sp. SG2303]